MTVETTKIVCLADDALKIGGEFVKKGTELEVSSMLAARLVRLPGFKYADEKQNKVLAVQMAEEAERREHDIRKYQHFKAGGDEKSFAKEEAERAEKLKAEAEPAPKTREKRAAMPAPEMKKE